MAKITKDKLAEIGEYLLKGMNEKEACILVDYPYEDFLIDKEESSIIRNFLEQMLVKFKLTHIEVIQKTKSEKNSMYLLEKLRPEEFGSKKGGGGDTTVNIINAVVKEIQDNGQTKSIISFNRGDRQEDQNDKIKVLEVASVLK